MWTEIDPLSIADFVTLPSRGGADQIADTSRFPTCWDFEDPLPTVIATILPLTTGAFYDVGANTGYYSILVGKLDPSRTVAAFEPVPEIQAILHENLVLNRVDARLHEAALSDTSGVSEIFLPDEGHGLIETSASLNEAVLASRNTRSIEVRVETLNAVNADNGAERVGLIKVDVEGMEHAVLGGAHDVVGRDRPLLVIEVLGFADLDLLQAFIDAHEYVPISLRPGMRVELADRLQFVPDGWNHLLCPRERCEEVLSALSAQAARDLLPVSDSWRHCAAESEALLLQMRVTSDVNRQALSKVSEDLVQQLRNNEQIVAHDQSTQAELADTRRQLEDARIQLESVRAQLDEVLNSRSWRYATRLRRMIGRP